MTKEKKRAWICVAGVAVTVVMAMAVAIVLLANARTENREAVRIYLTEGCSYAAMADTLRAKGIASHNVAMEMAVRIGRGDGAVRAGSYVVEPQSKVISVVRMVRNGNQSPIRLVIGKYRMPEQLNEYLDSRLMRDDFAFDKESFQMVRPDTYEVYWTIRSEQLEARLRRENERFWQQRKVGDSVDCCGVRLSRHEVITLASIVEEESNNAAERRTIASVYLNRLRRGMLLQADPTVKYAVGDFGLRRILNKHLTTESAYNTYLHAGLPPTAICLPSAQSVDAVLTAPESSYLYFCASEAMDGTHRFASTLSEHNRNAARFHAALNSRGIR